MPSPRWGATLPCRSQMHLGLPEFSSFTKTQQGQGDRLPKEQKTGGLQ